MENLGKFTLVIIAIIAASLISLLGVHIILSIATLYKLAFITGFTFLQLYGVLIIISIAGYGYKKEEQKASNTFMELVSSAITTALTKTLFLLLSWGLAFVFFNIIS